MCSYHDIVPLHTWWDGLRKANSYLLVTMGLIKSLSPGIFPIQSLLKCFNCTETKLRDKAHYHYKPSSIPPLLVPLLVRPTPLWPPHTHFSSCPLPATALSTPVSPGMLLSFVAALPKWMPIEYYVQVFHQQTFFNSGSLFHCSKWLYSTA